MPIPLVYEGKLTENYFKKLCLSKIQFQLLRWAISGPVTLVYKLGLAMLHRTLQKFIAMSKET